MYSRRYQAECKNVPLRDFSTSHSFNLTVHPQNVLIAQRPPDSWSVKVCDLGLSKRVEQAAGGNASTSIHFSPGYCPPEKTSIFDNHENIDGYKADMWCLGEVVFRVLTGKQCFKNVKEMAKWCRTGEGYPDQLLRDLHVSEDAIDFLHSVMAGKPEDRPTAEAACGHSWWADVDTPPPKGRLAPSLTPTRSMSRRSGPDMCPLPLEAPCARRASCQSHPCLDHETWSDCAPPCPRRDTTTSGWAASPPSSTQNDPYGTRLYQQTYPASVPQLPMADELPWRRRQLESGPFARQDYNLHRAPHSRRLADDTRPMKARLILQELLRQLRQQRNIYKKRAQNTSGSHDELEGPQQQHRSHPKQVRFADEMHHRSRGSPQQESDHDCQSEPTQVQRKSSGSGPTGPRRAVTLRDLTIRITGQPAHILVNPTDRQSKKRPQTGRMVNQTAIPEASFGQRGEERPFLNSLPNWVEETARFKETQVQRRRQEECLARLDALLEKLDHTDNIILTATAAGPSENRKEES